MRTSGRRASKLVLLTLLMGIFAAAGAMTAGAVPRGPTPCAKVLGESLTKDPGGGGVRAASGTASRAATGVGAAGSPSGSLPATGASPLGLVLVGVSLILAGGALTIVAGPRRGTAALVIGLSILASISLITPSRPAAAQTATAADACVADPGASDPPAAVPPPVVPEVPLPGLLPVIGLATAAGAVVISRRRRRPRTP